VEARIEKKKLEERDARRFEIFVTKSSHQNWRQDLFKKGKGPRRIKDQKRKTYGGRATVSNRIGGSLTLEICRLMITLASGGDIVRDCF